MKRAVLAAVLIVTWPLGAWASTPGADTDGTQMTVQVPARQGDERRGDTIRRVTRDASGTWSEPFYRYGHREPAMEELAMRGDSSEREAAALKQFPH